MRVVVGALAMLATLGAGLFALWLVLGPDGELTGRPAASQEDPEATPRVGNIPSASAGSESASTSQTEPAATRSQSGDTTLLADLRLPPPVEPSPVLSSPSGPSLDRQALRGALRPLLKDPDLRRHTGLLVRDLGRDEDVLRAGAKGPFTSASSLKLLTATAALSELGDDHRFETSVVQARSRPARRPTLALIGGGDPLLASTPAAAELRGYPRGATLAALAADSARELRADGVRQIRLGYDAGMFTGLAEARTWESGYVPDSVVSPISALQVDGGAFGSGADPARAAANAFGQALTASGVRITGGEPVKLRVPSGSEEIAVGRGAALEDVVEHIVQVSDNEGAEILLRHVGLATGRAGSFAGGAAGARAVLDELGVPVTDLTMDDGSGLSRSNRVGLDSLLAVLTLGADADHPDLRVITTGLPVAGFTGSLRPRFMDAVSTSGRGLVRAKTGTLQQVHALAGTVVTRDGTLLGFAALTDRVRLRDNLDARQQIDQLAAALAACGCTG
ncbi:MAG: D-alanyl-D-alanine carboxypeptidase/D-alanyl-D-alanine-endopeptidase [Actinomycetota bacterium]|nr:D-alanyl-D-alanine carboxypeptidase/D-alanyl-D-alanine-endopeptidase [Actinomycetota bacterium]